MRKQATAAAVATLAIVLTIAGVVLLILLRSSLLDNARDLAIQHLDSVVEQISEDDSVDIAGDITGTDTQITQILRPDGTLEATSDDAFTEPLYAEGALSPGETYVSAQPGPLSIVDFDDYLTAATGIGLPE
ncbi:hypothetical protein ACX80O_14100, partial [Arthrobacter sp. Hz1]